MSVLCPAASLSDTGPPVLLPHAPVFASDGQFWKAGQWDGRSGFELPWGQEVFLLSRSIILALGPTQTPIQWVPVFLAGVKAARVVILTTHLHVLARSVLVYAFMQQTGTISRASEKFQFAAPKVIFPWQLFSVVFRIIYFAYFLSGSFGEELS